MEFLALSVVYSLASVMPVFVGQNFGAKKFDRIRTGLRMGQQFALIYGVLVYGVLFILARPIASLFTKEALVIDIIVLYMRLVPLEYAFMGSLQIITSAFNALHKPIRGAALNLIQMMGIYVPLATFASRWIGVGGIFSALVFSYLVVSIPSYFLIKKAVNNEALKV